VYRVNATVEGRNLDECAVVGIDSRIRPYFLDLIEGDPDVTGLVVFLETPEGEPASRKIRYIPDSSKQSSGTGGSTDDQILGADVPEIPAGQPGDGETGSGKIDSGVDENLDAESGIDEIPPVDDGYSSDENSSREKEDGEQFSGADGGREREAVYQIRGKRSFSGTETAEPDELVVYVPKLSKELPALLFPETLAVGPYILVFQVLGLQGVLSHSEKLIYYISDAELALGDIQTYHSGNVERSGIVSPGSVLMLETKVNADDRLEPYIVWYHGRNRLKEGPVSEGVDRLLWRTPAQTGFQALKAEIFPFAPPAAYKNTGGLVKQLSLAISSKQARRAAGTETSQPDSLIRWYQLGGDISDSLAPQDSGRELKPGGDTVITWLPKTGIYGLAAGSGHFYTISGSLFAPDENLPGRGQFVFRLAVQSSGIIFSGIFTLDRTSQTLQLDLSCDADTNRLTLSCALGDEKQDQILFLPFSVRDEWITVAVDFITENRGFWAELSLLSTGNGEIRTELASLSDKSAPAGKGIVLPGALTGEGVFRIGAAVVPANSSTGRASALPGNTAGEGSADSAAINLTAMTQIAGDTPVSLPAGEENPSAAALTNMTAAATPVLTNARMAKTFGTETPASALILDTLAFLFRLNDSGTAGAVEPADETGTGDETGAVESASEDTSPPGDLSSEQSGVQTDLSGERTVSASRIEQARQSSLPAKAGTEKDTGRGSAEKESPQPPGSGDDGETSGNRAGKETASAIAGEDADLTEKTEDDDQTPDTPAAKM
jgi:hypothetical protein